MKAFTKAQIIKRLQELPDLPVIVQCDSDMIMTYGVTSIEVVYAEINPHPNIDEYNCNDEYCIITDHSIGGGCRPVKQLNPAHMNDHVVQVIHIS